MAWVGKTWPLPLLEVASIRNQVLRSAWRNMANTRNSGHDVRSRLWSSQWPSRRNPSLWRAPDEVGGRPAMDNRLLVNSGSIAARGKVAIPKTFKNAIKKLQRVSHERKGLHCIFHDLILCRPWRPFQANPVVTNCNSRRNEVVRNTESSFLYIPFYCTTSLITDYKYTYVTINGL